MKSNDATDWMWGEALQMLAQAERMHRQMFRPARASAASWEPPVDVIETEGQVLILAALPGVDPEAVEALIEDGVLRIRGVRVLPPELRTAVIHRLELPQGRFERAVPLPPGRYSAVGMQAANGCLLVTLQKSA